MNHPTQRHSRHTLRTSIRTAILLALLPCSMGFAQSNGAIVQEPTCTITFYGVFGSKAADARLGKQVNVSPEYMLDQDRYAAQKSTAIPLAIGTSFGVLRRITNITGDNQVQLVISHPEMTNPNGQVSKRTVVQSAIANLGELYRFDLPYALVAGAWSFDYQYRGKSLCKQEFDLR